MSKTPNEGAKGGDDSVTVRTSDGQQVYIDVTVLYRINADKANIVHLKWQNRYEEDFVRATVRSYIRDVISGYVVDDLLTAKPVEIETKINNDLKSQFSDNGLDLTNIQLRQITFTDDFAKAV